MQLGRSPCVNNWKASVTQINTRLESAQKAGTIEGLVLPKYLILVISRLTEQGQWEGMCYQSIYY